MGSAAGFRRSMLVVGILGAMGWPASPAGAAEATITFQVTLPTQATDWSEVVALPRFDPELGDLRSIELKLDSRLDGTIGLENLTATDVTLTASLAATVTLSRPGPGPSLLTAAPTVTRSDPYPAYDGIPDYGGDSGRTRTVNDSGSAALELTGAADLTLFTGTTPLPLPATAAGTSTAPAAPDTASAFTSTANAKVTVTYTYITDTRPPDAPTIDSGPALFTSDPNPIFTFTAEDGAATECQLATPTAAAAWSPCDSPWQAHLGPADDGMSTFRVRATDSAGNRGPETERSFTLDRVAPGQPSFTTTPPVLSQNAKPTWSFTIDPGTTARCSLDGAAPVPCASPQNPDLTLAADGAHTLTIVAVDAAGNAGASATSTYTLDRVGPAAPTISAAPTSPGNDTTPTWSFDLATDAAGATCSIDSGPFTACASPFTANLTTALEGNHTLAVRNADAAGNPSLPVVVAYRLDHTAPDAPTITSPPSPSKDPQASWVIDVEPGATTQCRLDGGSWATCSGSFTTTFPAGSDGLHLLTVRAADQAGNVGAEATATFILDTTSPVAPSFTITPADPSNSDQPSWSFTVEGGASPQCSVDDGAFGPCTTASSHTADLTGAADGIHELAVRAIDEVGNTGPSLTSTFTLDRDAPVAPTITSSPVSPGSAATVTWTYTVPPGSTTTCRVDGGMAFDCPDGTVTRTFTTDDEHRFSVRARDAAGNRSAVAMSIYVLDRVGPAAPTFLSVPDSPSNTSTPQWTFQVEAGATGHCSLDDGPWVVCTDSFTVDLSTAADGTHQLEVQGVDAAKNPGAIATGTVVLDRTAPALPSFSVTPDASSSDDSPSWEFAVDGDATAECRLDDGPWVPCALSLTADLAGALDGTHALQVRAVDEVGNVGPAAVAAFVLDRRAPAAPVVLTAPLSPGRDPDPVWTVDYEAGATLHCTLDGDVLLPCEAELWAPMADDGVHVLVLWVVDSAGNTSPSMEVGYELDRVAPTAPVVTAPRSPDHEDRPSWGITVDDDAVAECAFDDDEPASCGAVFRPDAPLADGAHHLSVVARDAAGNTSEVVVSTYLLDTAAPSAPVFTQLPDASHHGWAFSMETGARGECSLDGNPWAACSSPLPLGDPTRPVHLDVRATDRAGNRSAIAGASYTPPAMAVVVPVAPIPPAPPAGGVVLPWTSPPATTAIPAPSPLEHPAINPESALLRPSRAAIPTRGVVDDRNHWRGPVAQLLQSAAEKTTIPGLVILVVIAFVATQNRIDRRDPKLANAPLRHEPEYLEFR